MEGYCLGLGTSRRGGVRGKGDEGLNVKYPTMKIK
jgi:hypothetical protein